MGVLYPLQPEEIKLADETSGTGRTVTTADVVASERVWCWGTYLGDSTTVEELLVNWKAMRKALGALLGGLTGGTVAYVAIAFGLEVPDEVAAGIAVLLATVGTWLAPRNVQDALTNDAGGDHA